MNEEFKFESAAAAAGGGITAALALKGANTAYSNLNSARSDKSNITTSSSTANNVNKEFQLWKSKYESKQIEVELLNSQLKTANNEFHGVTEKLQQSLSKEAHLYEDKRLLVNEADESIIKLNSLTRKVTETLNNVSINVLSYRRALK